MKHTKYLEDFLSNHVNLNQSRINTLEDRIKAVTNVLKDNLEGYRKEWN